jgi:hypothetical protein
MDLNLVITEIENTGATVLEATDTPSLLSIAVTSTDYNNFKQVLLIVETNGLPDYPNMHTVTYSANLCKFSLQVQA